MRSLSKLTPYFMRYKCHLIGGLCFILCVAVLGIVPVWLTREALNVVAENLTLHALFHDTYQVLGKSIFFFGSLIVGASLLKGVCMFWMRQTIIVMSRHIEYDLKNDLYAHLQRLSPAFYMQYNTGDLLARMSEDVSRVRMYLGPVIMYGINLLVLFGVLIPMMLYTNVRLALYTLLPLPFLSLSIYLVNSRINRRSERIQRQLSVLSTFVQETFSGIRVIQTFVRERDFSDRFTEQSKQYCNNSLHLARVEALFFPLMLLLVGISTVAVVYIGSLEVMAGNLSIGNIAEFIMYVHMLSWPVASLGWASSLLQRAAASQTRINALFAEAPIVTTGELKPTTFDASIRFDHVTFGYQTDRKVLRDISFTVPTGGVLAIVGEIGSGKSTLAKLIARLYAPETGDIYIGEQHIEAYDMPYFRAQIGYVPQDSFLFSDSVANNIAYGSGVVDRAIVEKVAKEVQLYEEVSRFEQGFDTIVGERGIMLSGGQKQRIALARALIRTPKLILLDDCLSAVDATTERAILQHFRSCFEQSSVCIITNRVAAAQLADHIIVLEEGRIVAEGTHQSLMQLPGFYAAIYAEQHKKMPI